ncbi:NAD(P)/FAD-dependent oxidoreductase [Comamonas fluminis]|uniref:NAD(P)/FAD-dependent oxidoreductase n=1 Tax=Comamonas fluminis TaxID=2796366 RepID=UPI001C48A5CB|nr:FAD-dependent oxidoreductase [Comamonas fluminis]
MTNNTVAVLGAGMVGVATALELQRRGLRVTLMDRRAPGLETSYGNAGVIARSSLMPFNHHKLWGTLPGLLKNKGAGFRYNPFFVASNLKWALGFLGNARQKVFEETAAALDGLIRLSTTEHLRLLTEVNARDRLRDNGWLFLYRTAQAFNTPGAQLGRDTMARFGIRTQTLSGSELQALEPALNPVFEKALWVQDSYSVNSPGAVVKAYADAFVARGGQIQNTELRTLRSAANGQWQVVDGSGQTQEFGRVVVALGPWAPKFLADLGVDIPMGFERGYHMHYAGQSGSQHALQRPIYDTAGGYVLSPMEQGLRLSTGVELNRCDAPMKPVQLEIAEAAARKALPLGERLEHPLWMGRRPTLPDSRPIIDEMPGRPGLWLAFGHQHIGFSTGPGTAALLAGMMLGDKNLPLNPHPFRASRFL